MFLRILILIIIIFVHHFLSHKKSNLHEIVAPGPLWTNLIGNEIDFRNLHFLRIYFCTRLKFNVVLLWYLVRCVLSLRPFDCDRNCVVSRCLICSFCSFLRVSFCRRHAADHLLVTDKILFALGVYVGLSVVSIRLFHKNTRDLTPAFIKS